MFEERVYRTLNQNEAVENRMAEVVGRLILFFPIPIVGLSATMYYLEDQTKSVVFLFMLVPLLLAYLALRAGHLRWSVMVLATLLNAVVTWSCISGNGIHDLSITVFPFIILFASLILRRGDLLFVSMFSIVCICFIVLGEKFALFETADPSDGRGADLIILTMILLTGLFTTSSLTKVIKKAIRESKAEIQIQQAHKATIEDNVKERTEILRQVHHRVKNHLSLINSVIDIKAMEKPNEHTDPSLKNLIIALARIHDRLFQGEEYEQVIMQEYLPGILDVFANSYSREINVNMPNDKTVIHTHQAILLALLLHEIVSLTSQFPEGMVMKTDISMQSKLIVEVLILGSSPPLDKLVQQRISHLAQELNGKIDYNQNPDRLIFKLEFTPSQPHTSTLSQSA